jgi:hypothetical protein
MNDIIDKTMSGAELKVILTGLGLTPAWLAEQLHVTSRTILRWMDDQTIPARAVAVIETVSEVTDKEIEKIAKTARIAGVLYTRRTDDEGVAERNTLSANWHRHATFRALNSLHDSGTPVKVEYA